VFRSFTRCWVASLLVILLPGISQAKIRLGKLSFDSPAAVALDELTPLSSGLKSVTFMSSVGGVAFGRVAQGPATLTEIRVQYLPDRPDGQRLWVHMWMPGGVQTVLAPIYDWQLVPIARFAASEQHACFTLFGDLKDRDDAKARRGRGEKIMNYHPAFADSLLGLRLMQSDIQILYPDACDLPADGGRYILGAGEAVPNPLENYHALSDLKELIESLDRKDGNRPFRSYIICDEGRVVNYSAGTGRLVLTGDPIWYCWRWKDDSAAQAKNRSANDVANKRANRRLRDEYEAEARSLRDEELERKYSSEYRHRRFLELHREVYEQEMGSELEVMPAYSAALSRDIRELNGINPAVYDALVTTMRYAAFFRDLRRRDRAGFDQLLRDLEKAVVAPSVETPTVMVRQDDDASPPWLLQPFEQGWVTTAYDATPLLQGSDTVAVLSRGQSFRVHRTQGPFYWVRVLREGGADYGWLYSGHVTYETRQFSYKSR
jgi:hypothetical protein